MIARAVARAERARDVAGRIGQAFAIDARGARVRAHLVRAVHRVVERESDARATLPLEGVTD